jgi:hypothetical protein
MDGMDGMDEMDQMDQMNQKSIRTKSPCTCCWQTDLARAWRHATTNSLGMFLPVLEDSKGLAGVLADGRGEGAMSL